MRKAPAGRVRILTSHTVRPEGKWVLYWMTAHRRLSSNFALQHAVSHAIELGRPLIIFEPLAVHYPWASDRLHRFVIDGMAAHARALAGTPALYLPHVERARGEGRRLLDALVAPSAVVVTDDFPGFFLPRMLAGVAARMPRRLEAVDSNGLLPLALADKPFTTAYSFRAHLHRELRPQLASWPEDIQWTTLPTMGAFVLPEGTPPPTPAADLEHPDSLLASLPIDHAVGPTGLVGGARAGQQMLRRFVADKLAHYADRARHPDLDGTSGLSPYLHFGHIAAHEVFSAVMSAEGWTSRRLATAGRGKREGWWGVSPGAEAFLDQLITWRELGLSSCATQPDEYDSITSLPAWARRTLMQHAGDDRPRIYSRAEFESAATHDDVWNAAQRQMVEDGVMHTYLRMLWGKKILEWTPAPEEALETMIQLMNRHALDGRDPNSYTGYTWTLGRYDRPWAPERPVFGSVRYMSSDNTRRKLKIAQYLRRYGTDRGLL